MSGTIEIGILEVYEKLKSHYKRRNVKQTNSNKLKQQKY